MSFQFLIECAGSSVDRHAVWSL